MNPEISHETAIPENTSRNRLVRDSTTGAGAVVILALFVMVNYLAIRHYQRFDWTSNEIYSLSRKSLNIVEGITEEIDLVVFISPDSPIYGPVNELLSSYAAANPKLRKREIDPAKNLIEAQRLVQRYNIERDNVLIVASGDDLRVIEEFELAEYDYSGAQMGQPATISEFKGEQLITSALLALVEAKKPKVLFTTGHGEAPLDRGGARSLSLARDLLEGDGFETEQWSSLGKSEVSADTDLLVIAGPTTNFLPPELEVLSGYLDAGGRLMIMLDPVFAEGAGGMVDLGFTEWLAGYGVEIRHDIVIDPTSELPFYGPETIYTDSYGSHPVVEALDRQRIRVLLPLARSVSASDPAPGGFEVTELVRTSEAAWGEIDLENLEQVAPGEEDVQGPVTLAVAVSFEVEPEAEPAGAPEEIAEEISEQGAEFPEEIAGDVPSGGEGEGHPDADFSEELGEGDLSPASLREETQEDGEGDGDGDGQEARMIVFGDLDFASDSQVANAAHKVLLLNALNWLVEREELIDIEARKPEQTTVTLSRGELSQVYLLVLAIMPGLAVAFGVWVYLRRRR